MPARCGRPSRHRTRAGAAGQQGRGGARQLDLRAGVGVRGAGAAAVQPAIAFADLDAGAAGVPAAGPASGLSAGWPIFMRLSKGSPAGSAHSSWTVYRPGSTTTLGSLPRPCAEPTCGCSQSQLDSTLADRLAGERRGRFRYGRAPVGLRCHCVSAWPSPSSANPAPSADDLHGVAGGEPLARLEMRPRSAWPGRSAWPTVRPMAVAASTIAGASSSARSTSASTQVAGRRARCPAASAAGDDQRRDRRPSR